MLNQFKSGKVSMSNRFLALLATGFCLVLLVVAAQSAIAKTTPTSCCVPGAECCVPGADCCEGQECCVPGAACCVPGAPCCEAPNAVSPTVSLTAVAQAFQLAKSASNVDCCQVKADCCVKQAECCTEKPECCVLQLPCCVEGAACCK